MVIIIRMRSRHITAIEEKRVKAAKLRLREPSGSHGFLAADEYPMMDIQ
jgi:hypothetical protein